MDIDEQQRLHLYEQAREAFGEPAAGTLMQAIPRDPDKLATKDDVAVQGSNLRTEMAIQGAELRTEMAELRGEIKAAAADTVRTVMFGLIATNATLVGLVFAAVKLA